MREARTSLSLSGIFDFGSQDSCSFSLFSFCATSDGAQGLMLCLGVASEVLGNPDDARN